MECVRVGPSSRVRRLAPREVVAEQCRRVASHLGVRDIIEQLCRSARALTSARAVFGCHVPAPENGGLYVRIQGDESVEASRGARSALFAVQRRLGVERGILVFRRTDPDHEALLKGLSSPGELLPVASACGTPIFGRGGRIVATVVLVDADYERFDDVDLEALELLGEAAGTALANAHRYAFAKRDQERLFLLQEAAGDAVWDWDLERDEIWWGGGIVELLGAGELEVSKLPAWKMQRIAEADAQRVSSSFARALLSNHSSWTEEYCLIRADGSLLTVEDRAYFVRDSSGRAFRVVGALHDVSERKRLEEARVAAAAAEAARQELEAFNYSVSHDLRAPLRPLHGFSQALAEDYGDKLDAKAHEYLSRIRAAAQRMGQLIEDLFQLSRTGLADMSVGTVDLASLADTIVSELRNEDPSRTVTFVSASDLRVPGDPGLLRIALENLLANAWKFTRKTAAARIEIGSYRDAGGTVFFVRDNGAGFHPAAATRLFQPFRRLHPASEFEGTGIGLAIVDRVIRRHGGRIWVDAREGRGATFYFTLRR